MVKTSCWGQPLKMFASGPRILFSAYITFFSLLQIWNLNNAYINIPVHSSGHLSGVLV